MSKRFWRRRAALRASRIADEIPAPAPTSLSGPATLQQIVHKVHIRDQEVKKSAAEKRAEQDAHALFAGQMSEFRAKRTDSSGNGRG
ncbi:hypothetical protein A2866_06180 [Candidatus Roizmanbacteria bacterium RIFCSPHIGHO2_01_FULL_39_8]|uniref:Uncharacterized protein n=2 Tax=Candidatus Roizmaniibacteriota TaxID=1752723 RepID=A0A1F7GTS2_9BACT|nr:MAG: hypothetical protein A2866_06180 [Candidatus Roizmanbacteria bacterium RIFCSPHIGHO2_01_FULL_39_8]OGK37851.1 MAG: hypothetical protein A3F60_02895 [Candidatus Roizmanbacteria bacterium RIFCSPHIGHO2_12_FULL_39_8]